MSSLTKGAQGARRARSPRGVPRPTTGGHVPVAASSPAPAAPRSALVALSTSLVVLHLAPPNILSPGLGAAVVVGIVGIMGVGLWRDRDIVRTTSLTGLVIAATAASVPMVLTFGDLGDLLAAVSITAISAATVLCAGAQWGASAVRLVRVVLGIGVLEVAVAAVQAFSGAAATWGYLGDKTSALVGFNPLLPSIAGRAVGTMGHPIPLGMLAATCLVVVVADSRAGTRGARTVLAGTFALGLVLSGARGAVIATVVGLLAVLLGRTAGRWAVVLRVVAVVGVLGFLASGGVRESALVRSLDGSFSLTHRLGSLGALPQLFARPAAQVLFGSGHGSATALYDRGILTADGQYAIDNQLVMALATGGVVGLAALVLFCVVLLRRVSATLRPALVTQLVMFAVFDVNQWYASWAVLLVVGTLGTAVRSGAATDEGDVMPLRSSVTPVRGPV